MLAEFSVTNFRSIADCQTLSLVAGPDRQHPGHLYSTSDGNRLLKSAALFGKNASGKSNFIAAMRVMQQFVVTSATRLNAGDPIPGISPFRLDSVLREQPSRFVAQIVLADTLYEYGFEATSGEVVREWLKEGEKNVFWRDGAIWDYSPALREAGPTITKQTRNNALFLSVGAQFNSEILTPVYTWFKERFRVLDMSTSPMFLVMKNAERIRNDVKLRDRFMSLISDADFGIADIKISEIKTDDDVPDEMKSMFTEAGLKMFRLGNRTQLHLHTMHWPTDGQLDPIEFNFLEDESHGTQRVFAIAGPLLDAIANGALIVIDEFDCSMHPMLAQGLIRYFTEETSSNSGSQLLLATHNIALFTGSIFRRDELWLVDKYDDGKSRLSSLYDRENAPRSVAAFVKTYLRGDWGGVPALGPSLDRPEALPASE
jgi:AAA15 family ATPase/GTPase